MLSSLAAAAWAGGEVRRPLPSLEGQYREAVLEGWRLFQTSQAEDGVACVDCHLDHADLTGWARAYPKVQTFDGTPHRVKTLHRVVVEAMVKHTDLPPPGHAEAGRTHHRLSGLVERRAAGTTGHEPENSLASL